MSLKIPLRGQIAVSVRRSGHIQVWINEQINHIYSSRQIRMCLNSYGQILRRLRIARQTTLQSSTLDMLSDFSVVFLSPSKQTPKCFLKIWHDCFLPCYFESVIRTCQQIRSFGVLFHNEEGAYIVTVADRLSGVPRAEVRPWRPRIYWWLRGGKLVTLWLMAHDTTDVYQQGT